MANFRKWFVALAVIALLAAGFSTMNANSFTSASVPVTAADISSTPAAQLASFNSPVNTVALATNVVPVAIDNRMAFTPANAKTVALPVALASNSNAGCVENMSGVTLIAFVPKPSDQGSVRAPIVDVVLVSVVSPANGGRNTNLAGVPCLVSPSGHTGGVNNKNVVASSARNF